MVHDIDHFRIKQGVQDSTAPEFTGNDMDYQVDLEKRIEGNPLAKVALRHLMEITGGDLGKVIKNIQSTNYRVKGQRGVLQPSEDMYGSDLRGEYNRSPLAINVNDPEQTKIFLNLTDIYDPELEMGYAKRLRSLKKASAVPSILKLYKVDKDSKTFNAKYWNSLSKEQKDFLKLQGNIKALGEDSLIHELMHHGLNVLLTTGKISREYYDKVSNDTQGFENWPEIYRQAEHRVIAKVLSTPVAPQSDLERVANIPYESREGDFINVAHGAEKGVPYTTLSGGVFPVAPNKRSIFSKLGPDLKYGKSLLTESDSLELDRDISKLSDAAQSWLSENDVRDVEQYEVINEKSGLTKGKSYAEGGPVMALGEQTEMAFGEVLPRVDPISGNEVPPGAMPREVRDDIPAQLSEGEYVVPADVLQYYGIKFFEDLRRNAKKDLATLESGGRMGGEPIEMEDDLPFSDEELNIYDDEDLMQANIGGMVRGYEEGGAVTDMDRPGFLGGSPSVIKTYVNETGDKMYIRFVNGIAIPPVPPGYTEEGVTPTEGTTDPYDYREDPAWEEDPEQEGTYTDDPPVNVSLQTMGQLARSVARSGGNFLSSLLGSTGVGKLAKNTLGKKYLAKLQKAVDLGAEGFKMELQWTNGQGEYVKVNNSAADKAAAIVLQEAMKIVDPDERRKFVADSGLYQAPGLKTALGRKHKKGEAPFIPLDTEGLKVWYETHGGGTDGGTRPKTAITPFKSIYSETASVGGGMTDTRPDDPRGEGQFGGPDTGVDQALLDAEREKAAAARAKADAQRIGNQARWDAWDDERAAEEDDADQEKEEKEREERNESYKDEGFTFRETEGGGYTGGFNKGGLASKKKKKRKK